MRKFIYLVIVPTLFLSAIVFRTAVSQAHPQDSAVDSHAEVDNNQDKAVLLTPIQSGEPADAALINDMCKLKERQVQIYRLNNAPVNDVAESINKWLQARLKSDKASVNGFICNAPVIIVPDPVTNSLIVSVVADFEEKAELQTIIRDLDRSANQIEVHAVIKQTIDGKTTVLSSPKLIMRENFTGSITTTTPEGELTIELTARIVNPDDSTQPPSRTAKRPANLGAENSK